MDQDPLQHSGVDKVMTTASVSLDDGCSEQKLLLQQSADSADVYTAEKEAIITELDRIADKINRE